MTWDNARQKALDEGGDLIVIKNQNDQNFYENIIIDQIWIGLYQDLSSQNYSEPNGGWTWVDGTTLNHDGISFTSYQNWWVELNNNQPDNTNNSQNLSLIHI